MKILKLKITNRAGFTLLELLTSIFIIALLTGIFLANYRQADRQADLIFNSQLLISDIRYTQANALGLFKYEDDIPEGGWGIYFNKNNSDRYIIFADTNANMEYDEGEADEAKGGRIVVLPDGIEIDALQIIESDNSTFSPPELNIVFLPPDPRTYINGEYIDYKEAIITLKESNTEETAKIQVNFAGLVELID